MAGGAARTRYATRELGPATWRDFARLFSKHNGVWGGCWCVYSQTRGGFVTDGPRNRRTKHALVKERRAHGILVYADDEPVGWCAFGRREELPRLDGVRRYQALALDPRRKLWRITCFFVDRGWRRRGVAAAALRAALTAIRRRGGGVVEAYPATQSRPPRTLLYYGTVPLFEREGFRRVAGLGPGQCVMTKRVR